MFRVLRPGRWSGAVAVAAALGVAAVPSGAQQPEYTTAYGRSTVIAPERTDAGNWTGTWFYVNKRRKMALWMRVEDGTAKFMLRSQERGKNLLTDWDGQASYHVGDAAGEFSMTLDQQDDKTISGSWAWTFDDGQRGWKETADFTMYRTSHGRQLVMSISDWQRDQGGRSEKREFQVWTFRKASRRQALWAELPF